MLQITPECLKSFMCVLQLYSSSKFSNFTNSKLLSKYHIWNETILTIDSKMTKKSLKEPFSKEFLYSEKFKTSL